MPYLDILFLLHLGAFAVYLEPWHADIFEFLDLRKNHGKVELYFLVRAYANRFFI